MMNKWKSSFLRLFENYLFILHLFLNNTSFQKQQVKMSFKGTTI